MAGAHLEVKTSWTFASGFPQGIFDSDWKRLLPIEQLLGLLFKLCLSGPFPWFLGYPQGADSLQGAWVARGAPTRARGPGLLRGADSPPGLRLLLSFREAWGLTTRARCKVPCAECLSCCCWEGRAGDGEVGRPGWEVPLEPQA